MSKYRLQKGLAILGTTIGITASILASKYSKTITYDNVKYTNEDIANNDVFELHMEAVNLVDDNEVLDIPLDSTLRKEICKYHHKSFDSEIKVKDLRSIKILDIEKINNSDLQYFMFFSNLEVLRVSDSVVDMYAFRNSIKLDKIVFENVRFSGTSDIPNSVSEMILLSSRCTDDEFKTPYSLRKLDVCLSLINNLFIKNKDTFKVLKYYSDSKLDIACLKGTSLEELNIMDSPNIINANMIKELDIEKLFIDDGAAVWLDEKEYDAIESSVGFFERPVNLLYNIKKLDEIASKIDGEDALTKKDNIINYIVDVMKYDEKVTSDLLDPLGCWYNIFPVSSFIYTDEGICVNYAYLFQSLANRCGLECYLLSNDIHAWNSMIVDNNYIYVDSTFVDNDKDFGPVYRSFRRGGYHSPTNEIIMNYTHSDNIGYVCKEYRNSIIADLYPNMTEFRMFIVEEWDKIVLVVMGYCIYDVIQIKKKKKNKKRRQEQIELYNSLKK